MWQEFPHAHCHHLLHFHPSPFSAAHTLSHSHTGTPASHETPLESRRQQVNLGEKGNSGRGRNGKRVSGEPGQQLLKVEAEWKGSRSTTFGFVSWGAHVLSSWFCAINWCFFTFYARCRFGSYLMMNVGAAWNLGRVKTFRKPTGNNAWHDITLKLCFFKVAVNCQFSGAKGRGGVKSRPVNWKGKSNTQLAASGILLLEPEYQVKHVPTRHGPITAQWNHHTSETSTAAVFFDAQWRTFAS